MLVGHLVQPPCSRVILEHMARDRVQTVLEYVRTQVTHGRVAVREAPQPGALRAGGALQ